MQAKQIADFDIFKELDNELLQKIAEISKEKSYAAGDRVLQEGSQANEFYLIVKGKVNVLTDKWHEYDSEGAEEQVAVQTLQAGDVLGWSWLIPPYKWGFNADAGDDLLVIAVDGLALRDFVKKRPELEAAILRRFIGVMKQRLTATRMHLALHSGRPFVRPEGG